VDPDGSSVCVKTSETSVNPVTNSVSSDYSKVTFAPTSFAEIGAHNVSIILYDDLNAKLVKYISVTVFSNTGPYFTIL
jgi:hypothetical protein